MARLANKDEANAEFRRKFNRVFRRHREEYVQLLGEPPNAANVPESFWEKLRTEIETESSEMMILLFVAAATQTQIIDGGALRMTPTAAESAAAQFATARSREIASSAVRNTRLATQTAFDGSTLADKEITARVNSGRVFGSSRAESMGTTEATKAATAGGEEQVRRVERAGVEIIRIWQHQTSRPPGHANAAVDPCPICSPLEDLRLDRLPVQFREGPPAHPYCDCFIEYRFASPARTNPDKISLGEV